MSELGEDPTRRVPYSQQPRPFRDPTNDMWWRSTLALAADLVRHAEYERTGQYAEWSDAAMRASAGVSIHGRVGRFADVPAGEVADVARAFSERLAEEYGGEERIPHQIDSHESLPNVRAYMTRGSVDETLESAAISIVESADPPAPETYSRPDPAAIKTVRDAMSAAMVAARDDRSPAAGEENLGRRIGFAAAEAGVKAMNGVLANRELAQSVQKTMGPHATQAGASVSTTVDGAAARPTTPATQSKGLGSRG